MTPELQYILAGRAIELLNSSLNAKDSFFVFENNQLVEKGALSVLDQIEILFKEGLSVFTLVKNEFDKPTLLINVMIEDAQHNQHDQITNLLMKYIKEEELLHVPNEEQNNLLRMLVEYGNIKQIEQLFEKGYRLNFEANENNAPECNFAKKGNLEFFEILKFYQSDYSLNNIYSSSEGNNTLSEIIAEELPYEDNVVTKKKMENLKVFIDTTNLHTHLQNKVPEKSEQLKNKLKI